MSNGRRPTEATPFLTSEENVSSTTGNTSTTAAATSTATRGRWKDGLFDCFRFGFLHPALLNAICCPQVLLAQLATRMKLDWLGERAPEQSWRKTFRTIFLLVVIYITLAAFLAPPAPYFVKDSSGKLTMVEQAPTHAQRTKTILYNLITLTFGVYTICVLAKLRKIVRENYEIPEQTPYLGRWEDCCYSIWCTCCVLGQIARHTTEYEKRKALCCSDTGLPIASDNQFLAL